MERDQETSWIPLSVVGVAIGGVVVAVGLGVENKKAGVGRARGVGQREAGEQEQQEGSLLRLTAMRSSGPLQPRLSREGPSADLGTPDFSIRAIVSFVRCA